MMLQFRTPRTWLPALLLLAVLAGCQKPEAPENARVLANQQIRSDLYFGSRKPDGSSVTNAEWTQFVDQELTPAFPDGLTIQNAQGQYRTNAGELQHEETHVVTLIYPDDPRTDGKIEQLRDSYRKRFQQESVLWISHPVQRH